MIALPTETTETGRHGTAADEELPAPSSGPDQRPPRAKDAGGEASYEEIAAWLQNEAERHFTQGHYGAAEEKVRQLLDLQNQVVGQQHADFALGLSMLGELRFLQDDRAGAEGLFRRALAIRSRVLGRSHPDYAVSLTCLSGMLWRRGAFDEAERCLRESLAIRAEALGPAHPESIQGCRELVRVLRLKGQWAEAQATLRDFNDQAGLDGGPPSGRDLADDLVLLAGDLATLGETFAAAARRMASVGAPPPLRSVRALGEWRQRFDSLRGETLERINALSVPNPPPIELETVQDLASIIDDLGDAEQQRHELEQLRLSALTVLDRVMALVHASDDEFTPLLECQRRAAQLRDTIESGHWLELPTQTESLAEGSHALVNLLILVEEREDLSDREWAELHEAVGETLGKPLASAASRARLVVGEVPPRSANEREQARTPRVTSSPPYPMMSSQPAIQGPAVATRPTSNLDSALIRDLAVASLVPSMGTVINLPTASNSEVQAHRLLRVGQAPNVVERADLPVGGSGVMPTEAASRNHNGPAISPRGDTDRRVAPAIIAGPLPLLNSFGTNFASGNRLGRTLAAAFGTPEQAEVPTPQLQRANAPISPGGE